MSIINNKGKVRPTSFFPLYKSGAGFTFIEVIVYLALFSIIIGGAVVAAYNVIESSGRNQIKAMLQSEGDFMAGKLDWTLSNVQNISSPVVGNQSGMLTVSKYGGQNVTINLSGSDMRLQRGGNPPSLLNSSNVLVSNLQFEHFAAFGDGVNQESLKSSFTLSAKTPTGATYTQNFSTNKYLRK